MLERVVQHCIALCRASSWATPSCRHCPPPSGPHVPSIPFPTPLCYSSLVPCARLPSPSSLRLPFPHSTPWTLQVRVAEHLLDSPVLALVGGSKACRICSHFTAFSSSQRYLRPESSGDYMALARSPGLTQTVSDVRELLPPPDARLHPRDVGLHRKAKE